MSGRSPIAHPESVSRLMHELQDIGVRIVLDDVGSGFAALPVLAGVQPDVVKIDRSLLEQARQGPAGLASLTRIVRACASRSPCIVIEGVETRADLRLAWEAGAHAVQGYFPGKPERRPDWNQGEPCVVMNRFREYLTSPNVGDGAAGH
ncbi:EAL domain-containing protein [Castellaniella sp. WN]